MKRVIIMRGITGSGKSTYIRNHFADATVVSADHFFEQSGTYVFDVTQLEAAHRTCFKTFLEALERGDETIVVDNTNVEAWEVSPYVATAQALGYEPEIITLVFDPDAAARRSLHGMDPKRVAAKARALAAIRLPERWKQRVIDMNVQQSS